MYNTRLAFLPFSPRAMGNKGGKISAGGLKPKELAVLSETTRFTEAELRALWSQFASLKGGADSAATSLADLHISESEFQAALGFHGVGGSGGSVFLRRIFALFDENKDGACGARPLRFGCCRRPAAEGPPPLESGCLCSHRPPLRLRLRLIARLPPGLITFEEFCISIAALTPTAKPEARMKGARWLPRAGGVRDGRAHTRAARWRVCASSSPLPPPPPPPPSLSLPTFAVAFELYDTARRGAISPADVTFLLAHSFRENGAAISDAAVERIVADTFRQYDVNKDGLLDFAEFKHMCQCVRLARGGRCETARMMMQGAADEPLSTPVALLLPPRPPARPSSPLCSRAGCSPTCCGRSPST